MDEVRRADGSRRPPHPRTGGAIPGTPPSGGGELADRIRSLAADIAGGRFAWDDPANAAVLITDELEDLADAAQAAADPAQRPSAVLCGRQPLRGRQGPCDRPARHEGDCSWETDRIRRLAGDFEAEARKVPRLQRELDAAHRQAQTRDRELATLRQWKATVDKRDQGRWWRRARAREERG